MRPIGRLGEIVAIGRGLRGQFRIDRVDQCGLEPAHILERQRQRHRFGDDAVIEEGHEVGAEPRLVADLPAEEGPAAEARVDLLDQGARQRTPHPFPSQCRKDLVLQPAQEHALVERLGEVAFRVAGEEGPRDRGGAHPPIRQIEEVPEDLATAARGGHRAVGMARGAGGGIGAAFEQLAEIGQSVVALEVVLDLRCKFIRRDLARAFVDPLDLETQSSADRFGDGDILAPRTAIDIEVRRRPGLAKQSEEQPRVQAAGQWAEDAIPVMLDMRPDDRGQSGALALDALGERHRRRGFRQWLGERVSDGPGVGQLYQLFGAKRLQLGEDGVVAGRDDVEGEFIDALRVEGEPRQRLRCGEQRGREDAAIRIMEELEGGEIVGEEKGPAAPAHQSDEMAAQPAPVRPRKVRHAEQGPQRLAAYLAVAGQGAGDRDEIVPLGQQRLRPAHDVGRVEQPPAGQRMLGDIGEAVLLELRAGVSERRAALRLNEKEPGHAFALARQA